MFEDQAGENAAWARPVVVAPVLLLAAAGLSYGYADRGLPNPDESAGLVAAAKILRGAVFYRDIDAYPFPGGSYLLAGFMALFGEQLSVARALAGGVYCSVVLGLYAMALQLLEPRRAALFGASLLSLKFLAFPNFTAYLYSDLALAFAVVAGWLLVRRPLPGSSVAGVAVGLCIGLTVLSKQSTGIYLGAAVASLLLPTPSDRADGRPRLRRRLSGVAPMLAGFALGVVPALVYFASHGLLGQMLYSGLVRPFTGYLPRSAVSFSRLLEWWNLGSLEGLTAQPYFPLHYSEMIYFQLLPRPEWERGWWLAGEIFARLLYTSVPVAFGLLAWLWIRARREPAGSNREREGRRRLFSFGALALAITASAFPRADYPHIINVYPVVLLLLCALGSRRRLGLAGGRLGLGRGATRNPGPSAMLVLQAAAVALLLLVTMGLSIRIDAERTTRVEMERAQLWVQPRHAWIESVVSYVEAEVPEDRPLFVYGHEAYFYFLTGRYFPWRFVQLYPGMAGADQGRALARLLQQLRPRVVLQGVLEWPGMAPIEGYTPALRATIHRLYAIDRGVFRRFPPRGAPPEGREFRAWRLRASALGAG